jgi:hypothetical protein
MVKRKVSLNGNAPAATKAGADVQPSSVVLELFFNTGVVFQEVPLPGGVPDIVSGFVLMKDASGRGETVSARRASAGEEPDIELSAVEHLPELVNRWLPVPYQLSCAYCVQLFLVPTESGVRAMLAVDTTEQPGSAGRRLDARVDADRPFRPLDRAEHAAFFDHPETRELVRKLEKSGLEKALFKLAALLEAMGPMLPRLKLSHVESRPPIPVSLVVDFGNSRSAAVLCEPREKGMSAIPLEMRSSHNPFMVHEETFDSRVTFLPSAFDKSVFPVALGDSFASPSIVRMGREALDRALETPHRYQCTLSGPKRYLWDGRQTDDRWYFAVEQEGEHKPVFGRILKYVPEDHGGLVLRQDGPQVPADPRYAPRAVMLFAVAEILAQAMAQINAPSYRAFQGKEQNPRVLEHVVFTFPSAMRREEKIVYETLVRNAVILTSYIFNIPLERQPNWQFDTPGATEVADGRAAGGRSGRYTDFLFVDEALAAQMVYLFQEVSQSFSGSMEDFVAVYGHKKGTVRVASIDIGGGTSDVMIAEYADKMAGAGTSLAIKKLFQDGVSIAGDEVCRAIVEQIVFSQILQQLPSPGARAKLVHLFGEGDAGHGAAWRTLKAKLVPYFWLPLARCYWALAEGCDVPEHNDDKLYSVDEVFRVFQSPAYSQTVLAEADAFLTLAVPEFPGLLNLFFKMSRAEVERAVLDVLREPLRRYADIVAQFDVDLLVLAGRTSALKCIRELFVREMPVSAPRIKNMSSYRVGDWYPAKWQSLGLIKDPKSTVTAGATVLHLASKNRLPGFSLDAIDELAQKPIYGLYQDVEPHISYANELFKKGRVSEPVPYTTGMVIGFRNVASQEMDGSPLFEVRPATRDVEQALLEDRVSLTFELTDKGEIAVADVISQRDVYSFGKDDFTLMLKTVTSDRYWLDTGVFKNVSKYL